MIILAILLLSALLYFSICFRTVIFNPFKSIYYSVKDSVEYFKYKKWNNLQSGKLIAYVALFGKGKTLSVVHYVLMQYYKYNNKKIYDPFRKKWVTQKVHILSNVTLNVPFEEFTSLQQVINCAKFFESYDKEHDTLTHTLVLGDEFSVQMNSRSFKSNIDPLFLNTLLTCRHHHITIVYDAQRFQHVDALLRQVTSYVVSCNKMWRIMVSSKYDAWELENASSPANVRPLRRFGWFIQDKDFEAYDTLAVVDNLEKKVSEGDMLSESEIINLQSLQNTDMDNVTRPTRRWIRRHKKAR